MCEYIHPSGDHLFNFFLAITLLGTATTFPSNAQVKVPFRPRNTEHSPFGRKFEMRGDFVILGNTILTLQNYGDELKNDNRMVFVDVDNAPNTFNSSMARLEIGDTNTQPESSMENTTSIDLGLATQMFPNGTRFYDEFPITTESIE